MIHPAADTDAPANMRPTAVLFTADRFLVAQLDELNPAVTAITATTNPRFDGLPRGDGILVLADSGVTRSVYLGIDLDDARIWSRAVDVGATHVVVLPDGAPWLQAHLTSHLGPPAVA